MTPDIDKYRKYVDHFDLSEDKKIELIHTVWQMMGNSVDRAFRLDSVQLACGSRVDKVANRTEKLIPSSTTRLHGEFEYHSTLTLTKTEFTNK